jgi:hypothetical protein
LIEPTSSEPPSEYSEPPSLPFSMSTSLVLCSKVVELQAFLKNEKEEFLCKFEQHLLKEIPDTGKKISDLTKQHFDTFFKQATQRLDEKTDREFDKSLSIHELERATSKYEAILKYVRKIKRRKERKRNRCKICLEREKSFVFVPCGHFNLCDVCAQNVTTCPDCDAPKEKKVIQ